MTTRVLRLIAAALLAGAATPAAAADGAAALGYFLQQLVNATVIAALYSLLAVAYALLHGVTGRVIIAFGDIATFGALSACGFLLYAMTTGSDGGLALALVLGLATLSAAALGNAGQRALFGPLAREPGQALMIASVGFAIALEEVMRLQTSGRDQWLPPYLVDAVIAGWPEAYPVRATAMQAVTVLVAALFISATFLIIRFSRFGRDWRAVAQDPRLAALCGVDPARVMTISAMLAAGTAGAAGWIAATAYGGINAYMGLMLGLKALFAAIIGGFGRLGGAALGGVLLALAETLWTAYFPALYRDVAVFGLIVMIIALMPGGILGERDARESER